MGSESVGTAQDGRQDGLFPRVVHKSLFEGALLNTVWERSLSYIICAMLCPC